MQVRSIAKFFIAICSLTTLCVCAAGCGPVASVPTNKTFEAGNWQFVAAVPSSTNPGAAMLPSLSGALSGTSSNISGLLHVDVAGACVGTSEVIEVSGWTDQFGLLTLNGQVSGGTLTIQGYIAADGKSLVESGYLVAGGTCPVWTVGTAQYYNPVNGTYSGTVKDTSGMQSSLTANLSQSSTADSSGNFTLTGTGQFKANPCFTTPITITSSEVTGGNLQLVYVDPSTQGTVSVTGKITPDGKTLTVTNWATTGACGTNSGTGQLAQTQP